MKEELIQDDCGALLIRTNVIGTLTLSYTQTKRIDKEKIENFNKNKFMDFYSHEILHECIED